ncbi:MAG TPA: hypothetical protein VL404_04505 [Candidatus Eisenbacteria bacterium]|nr:hypothetical protein [Candidatus Eisenbacteria bacterium]
MNPAKSKDNTVLWWLGWIGLTILTFFAAAWFWTGIIARHYGDMHSAHAPAIWVTAVFGSWMVLLVPLIVVMYNKVDKAYEDARISRERASFEKAKKGFKVRSQRFDDADRLLDAEVAKKVSRLPFTLRQGYHLKGHLVTAVLKDGRRVENVFILDGEQVLGVYDQAEWTFRGRDVADVVPADLDRLPVFQAEKWLRLDGAGADDSPSPGR